MWRSILAIIVGIIVGGIVVAIIEIPGNRLHPLPTGTDMSDWNAIRSHAGKAPLAAMVGVAIAWTVGPLVGACVAAFIAGRSFLVHGMIVGLIFLLLDLMMISSLPHPLWLTIVGIVAPLISSYIGATLAARFARPPSDGPRPYDMR